VSENYTTCLRLLPESGTAGVHTATTQVRDFQVASATCTVAPYPIDEDGQSLGKPKM